MAQHRKPKRGHKATGKPVGHPPFTPTAIERQFVLACAGARMSYDEICKVIGAGRSENGWRRIRYCLHRRAGAPGSSPIQGTIDSATYNTFSECMQAFAACNNIFYIKNGYVQQYVAIGTGGVRCLTTAELRPGYRGSANLR